MCFAWIRSLHDKVRVKYSKWYCLEEFFHHKKIIIINKNKNKKNEALFLIA